MAEYDLIDSAFLFLALNLAELREQATVYCLATADFQYFGAIEALKTRDHEIEDHELLHHLCGRNYLRILQEEPHELGKQLIGDIAQSIFRKKALENYQSHFLGVEGGSDRD